MALMVSTVSGFKVALVALATFMSVATLKYDMPEGWVAKPQRNHGWILVGVETEPSTVRRIASRENLMVDQQPRLEVVYRAR